MFINSVKKITSFAWIHKCRSQYTSNCLKPTSCHYLLCEIYIKYCNLKNKHYSTTSNHPKDIVDVPHYLNFKGPFSEEETNQIVKDMVIIDSFLSSDEENKLLIEIEPYMKRLRYEFNHWDDAIHGFRETERSKWNEENSKIIDRVRSFAFPPGSPQISHVHILDLSEEGYIKPHIDSVRFCGHTIAGLSLLTDSVMRLVHDKDKSKVVDVLLKRRSMYIMRNCVRYDYTHEILSNKESEFKEKHVEKKRRISVICRNEPTKDSE